MGLIERVLTLLFGADRNVIAETAQIFRVNAEAEAARGAGLQGAALRQFAAEFSSARSSRFDRMIDGLNRLPRPALALGTLGLFIVAMVDPIWFGARMTGLALVPDPLWWLLGAIVSFYFGARHQAKGIDFQRDIARAMAASVPRVIDSAQQIEALRPDGPEPPPAPDNPALADWQALATK